MIVATNAGNVYRVSNTGVASLLASVGEDVSKPKPALHDAYEIVAEAAKRTAQGATQ